jgi:hypothetical protein
VYLDFPFDHSYYLWRRLTSYEAPRNELLSSFLLFHLLWVQIFSSAPTGCGLASDWLRAELQRGRSSSPNRGKIFLFSTSSRPILGPNQPPTQWVPKAVSSVVKRPGREADHSQLSHSERIQSVLLLLSSPFHPFYSLPLCL